MNVSNLEQTKRFGLKVSKIFPMVMKKFKKQRSILGKINLIYNEVEQSDEFIPDVKLDEKAVELRNKGVEKFATGDYLLALEYYTLSLAESTSKECQALTYANRSAALYKMDLHDECIGDIDRALAYGYPEHLRSKLIERRQNAEKNKATKPLEKYYEDIPEIEEDDRNPDIEAARNCIEIIENDDFDKHVIATRDIKVGEVILVEKPFVTMLSAETLFHCHDCLVLCYNPIPCDHCTQAFYCSEACKNDCFEKYHKYECPILLSINAVFGNVLQFIRLSLKMTFLVKGEDFEQLEAAEDLDYKSGRYKEIYNLIRHGTKNDDEEYFALCYTVAQLFLLVKRNSSFLDDFEFENREDKFKELLMRHLQIYDVNNSEISQIRRSSQSGFYVRHSIGGALYSVYSRLNHSCYPNVVATHHGTTLILRANASIKKGEQLFTSYGELYISTDRNTRRQNLKTKYHFFCKCRACVEDWPADQYISRSFEKYYDIKTEMASYADPEVAKFFIPQILEKLATIEHAAPSPNVNLLRDALHECYYALGNKRRI